MFTDGAYEPGTDVLASIEGVLVSPRALWYSAFEKQSPVLVDQLDEFSDSIHEVEVLRALGPQIGCISWMPNCPLS